MGCLDDGISLSSVEMGRLLINGEDNFKELSIFSFLILTDPMIDHTRKQHLVDILFSAIFTIVYDTKPSITALRLFTE